MGSMATKIKLSLPSRTCFVRKVTVIIAAQLMLPIKSIAIISPGDHSKEKITAISYQKSILVYNMSK